MPHIVCRVRIARSSKNSPWKLNERILGSVERKGTLIDEQKRRVWRTARHTSKISLWSRDVRAWKCDEQTSNYAPNANCKNFVASNRWRNTSRMTYGAPWRWYVRLYESQRADTIMPKTDLVSFYVLPSLFSFCSPFFHPTTGPRTSQLPFDAQIVRLAVRYLFDARISVRRLFIASSNAYVSFSQRNFWRMSRRASNISRFKAHFRTFRLFAIYASKTS